MRVTWISAAVILLDQCSKVALQYLPLNHLYSLTGGEVQLDITRHATLSSQQLISALSTSTSWALLGGLLTIHLLLSRWNRRFHFITTRTVIGLQLAAGGILSYAIDYVLRGAISSTARLQLFNHFTLNAGIADLALMAGFLLLFYTLLSGGSRIVSRITLLGANSPPLNLSPLARGIDNIHIDIHLSPEFCRTASIIVHQLVNTAIETSKQSRALPAPQPGQFSELKRVFHSLHQEALRRAKGSGEPQLVDLLYLALLKFIHGEVANCVTTRVHQTKETIQDHHKRGIGGHNDNRHVEHLFRHQEQIIASVNQLMFEGLVGSEIPKLHKGVRGFLGIKRLFAFEALQTPLVVANASESNDILFQHYLLFGRGKHREVSFLQFDRTLDDVLRDHLALLPNEDEGGVAWSSDHQLLGNDNTTAEILSRPSVLMHPANITILFDQAWTRTKVEKTSLVKNWRKYHKFRPHLRFQQRLEERLLFHLGRGLLTRWVVAFYEARQLIKRSRSDISPGRLIPLLVECESKKELQQRLETLCRQLKTPPEISQVVSLWEQIHVNEEPLLRQHLFTFIDDFARYRRDLLLLYRYHQAASQLNLLQERHALQTSRANHTLYEFLLPAEQGNRQEMIRSHIIIKADLRGSTEVTDRLNQLALNPATHFDRHFFSPINEVIDEFGAEKVFIEGDAIILIINDYGGSQQNPLIASRACGLAAGILRIVARQNRELLCYGLPQLELGIGIAHSKETPRFLFDGDHKITISPAINRADRLSACAWAVRGWRERLDAPETQVEVYQPSPRALGRGEKAQKALVYNLNGILIEPEVFELLNQELTPKRIVNTLQQKQESQLYAVKLPRANGESQSLVIRKAPLKEYDPDYRLNECPVVEGRYFYEVIHKQEIIDSLRNPARSGSGKE